MSRLRPALVVAFALLLPATALAASVLGSADGVWRTLPAAPIAPDGGLTSVWTGKEMLLFGVTTKRAKDGSVLESTNVVAAYNPAAGTWRRLPRDGPAGVFPPYRSVWTGKEMLVLGQGTRKAFNPRTDRWRTLPGSPLLSVHEGHGLVVWTGRELIGWGGGCCGDAFSDGVAYNPTTNAWRALAQAPLAGSQHPVGAWTGRELIVLVGGLDPDGKRWPARLARAAAYNPSTNTWRRIAPIPDARNGATAVWDGREMLVVGGAGNPSGGKPGPLERVGFAYNPATNRWRPLPPMESGRAGSAVVWTGRLVLVWGGETGAPGSTPMVVPPHGLAFDPSSNRWSPLPSAPLKGRVLHTAVWSGKELIIWGGEGPVCRTGGKQCTTKQFVDGAALRLSKP